METTEEIELIDYLRVIWKRRWLIILGTFACMLVALGINFWLPKVYQGSMILETGKIYSLTKGEQQEKVELIEDPKSIEAVLKSDGMLYELKKRIGYEGDLKALRQAISVDVKTNPLVVITLKLSDPQAIVDGLNFLAERIINDHKSKYELTIRTLDKENLAIHEKMKNLTGKIQDNKRKEDQLQRKIKNIEAQILIESEQINTDNTYQKTVEDQIKTIMETIAESKKRIADLDLKAASPLEILFLQTTLQNHDLRLADFKREINDLRQRGDERQKQISERQKQMADLRNQITDLRSQSADLESQIQDFKRTISTLENFQAVSENTRYRTPPVVHEKPVSPRKGLNTVIAGMIGFMTTLMMAFFVEYLENVNTKQIRNTG